jgi:hypothetical protein
MVNAQRFADAFLDQIPSLNDSARRTVKRDGIVGTTDVLFAKIVKLL